MFEGTYYNFGNAEAERRDYHYLKQLYPAEMRKIQQEIEELCDQMEYDGSPMFDEYPDRFMMRLRCKKVCQKCRNERNQDWIDQIVPVMLCQEMMLRRRRYRNYKNRNQFFIPY